MSLRSEAVSGWYLPGGAVDEGSGEWSTAALGCGSGRAGQTRYTTSSWWVSPRASRDNQSRKYAKR